MPSPREVYDHALALLEIPTTAVTPEMDGLVWAMMDNAYMQLARELPPDMARGVADPAITTVAGTDTYTITGVRPGSIVSMWRWDGGTKVPVEAVAGHVQYLDGEGPPRFWSVAPGGGVLLHPVPDGAYVLGCVFEAEAVPASSLDRNASDLGVPVDVLGQMVAAHVLFRRGQQQKAQAMAAAAAAAKSSWLANVRSYAEMDMRGPDGGAWRSPWYPVGPFVRR